MFAVLVIASLGAFLLTQRLKHTPTIVQMFKHTPYFSPTPAGHIKQERISFRIAQSDEVTVTVIDPSGDDVATLVRDYPLEAYKQLSLRWNGRRGSSPPSIHATSTGLLASAEDRGPGAPEGEYRVRVHLARDNRTVLSPWSFTLVRRPANHPAAGG